MVRAPVTQAPGHGYGVIYDPFDYRVYRVVDKPRKPINNCMGTSICVFRYEIVEYLERIHAEERSELTDIMQCVIDDGLPVKLFVVGSGFIEMNAADDPGSFARERITEHEWKLELEPVF